MIAAAPVTWVSASPGYSYSGVRTGVRMISASINSYTLGSATSHVNVYLNVSGTRDYMQVGIVGTPALKGLCAYVETNVNKVDTVRCLSIVSLGQRITLKLTYSDRYRWVAWVNGKPAGNVKMVFGITSVAAERYGKSSLQYTLN